MPSMLRELAHAVRSKELSARELVARALDRIERLDHGVNAVVDTRPEEAVEEARALDERVAAGDDPGPLAGIPCLIKDIEDLKGMRTTHGSVLFADAPPAARDGLIASRLRAAGAIPVGKTNTPELAAEGFTGNLVFGVTRNPWAPDWSPGGSSGGSGAAIAAGMVAIATATDTGGSVRIPAAFCGLVGLKPTNGVIGRDPALWWPDLTTSGPLGVSVDDVGLLLEVESGPVPGDPTALPEPRPPKAGMPRAVLATPRFTPWGPLPAEVSEAFDLACRRLEQELGLSVEPLEPEGIFRAGNPDLDWFVLCAPELVAWLGREIVERELERFSPTTRSFLEEGLHVSIDDYLAARARRFEYVREFDELVGDDVVIASPTVAAEGWLAEGPRPGFEELGPGADVYNCAVQNITGHPAISVPAGVLRNGVPFGLQFTGPRFADGLLLDLAAAWETASPWPSAAPGHRPFDED
jgi:Asp-tRNA(Asn)/Glu-tRNA(Gln) amidotransferase A subunit family amidase